MISLQLASGRPFIDFMGVYENYIENTGKFFVNFREISNSLEKVVYFRQNLDKFTTHFQESP